MGLGAKTVQKTDDLWVPVTSAKTGKTYNNIQRCTDLQRLDVDEPELSDLLSTKLNEALDNGTLSEADFKDWKKGFKYKHTDGWEYQFLDTGNGYKLTRMKPFTASGGYKKGGSFTFMRTSAFRIAKVEDVVKIINNQAPTDNWKVTWIKEVKGSDLFQMENMQPYTPAPVTSTTETKEESED